MPVSTFKTCVDKLPKKSKILFSGFSEPWLNPDCGEMVMYAHEKGFGINMFTTGVGMTLSDVEHIKNIPFQSFLLHLKDDSGLTQIKTDEEYLNVFEKLVGSEIAHFKCLYLNGKNGPLPLNPEQKKVLDRYNVDSFSSELSKRGECRDNSLFNDIAKKSGKLVPCCWLGVFNLLPSGDVFLCCQDWEMKHKIGNLLTQSFSSLYKSDEFQKVKNGLKDESSDILCRTCFGSRKKIFGPLPDAVDVFVRNRCEDPDNRPAQFLRTLYRRLKSN